jgi:hypothetical protein
LRIVDEAVTSVVQAAVASTVRAREMRMTVATNAPSRSRSQGGRKESGGAMLLYAAQRATSGGRGFAQEDIEKLAAATAV